MRLVKSVSQISLWRFKFKLQQIFATDELPQNLTFDTEIVKNDSIIIISRHQAKSVKHAVKTNNVIILKLPLPFQLTAKICVTFSPVLKA
jgi:hypothetical protein